MSAGSPCSPSGSDCTESASEGSHAGDASQAAEASGTNEGPEPGVPPGLYIVATPIGNLRDVTLRARDVLAGADVVVCEDTRVTARLLRAYELHRPMLSHHEHNAARRRPEILARLDAGEVVALVSDAGTPLISDPGFKLVREAREAGHPVTPIPGASAVLAALMTAGLPTDRFFFQGFLPSKRKARRETLEEVVGLRATLVFYESPNRLSQSLADMAAVLGPREAVVARELTKRFETVRADRLESLAALYTTPPKGEVVVVVGPPEANAEPTSDADLAARLRTALATESLRDAVAAVSAETGEPRKRVYRLALTMRGDPEA